MSTVTGEAILKAVDDQRMKLLNVLGGLQCMKVAARRGIDEVGELESAVELLEDAVQEIVTRLESRVLLRELEGTQS